MTGLSTAIGALPLIFDERRRRHEPPVAGLGHLLRRDVGLPLDALRCADRLLLPVPVAGVSQDSGEETRRPPGCERAIRDLERASTRKKKRRAPGAIPGALLLQPDPEEEDSPSLPTRHCGRRCAVRTTRREATNKTMRRCGVRTLSATGVPPGGRVGAVAQSHVARQVRRESRCVARRTATLGAQLLPDKRPRAQERCAVSSRRPRALQCPGAMSP